MRGRPNLLDNDLCLIRSWYLGIDDHIELLSPNGLGNKVQVGIQRMHRV